jgi:NAD-dependent deacetylase
MHIDKCELLVVIGTSGATMCIDLMISEDMYSILNNLEPNETLNHKRFDKVLFKPATFAIDEIVNDIKSFIKIFIIK